MSEFYEVGVESEKETEVEQFTSEVVARRAFTREADKVQPGSRVTLTKCILLDAVEGEP
jgi:hypothetical protein